MEGEDVLCVIAQTSTIIFERHVNILNWSIFCFDFEIKPKMDPLPNELGFGK